MLMCSSDRRLWCTRRENMWLYARQQMSSFRWKRLTNLREPLWQAQFYLLPTTPAKPNYLRAVTLCGKSRRHLTHSSPVWHNGRRPPFPHLPPPLALSNPATPSMVLWLHPLFCWCPVLLFSHCLTWPPQPDLSC